MEHTESELKSLAKKILFVAGMKPALVSAGIFEDAYYDVFDKDGFTYEYLVLIYRGGSMAARNCRGDSVVAILEELGRLAYSGSPSDYYDCYEEGRQYREHRVVGKAIPELAKYF